MQVKYALKLSKFKAGLLKTSNLTATTALSLTQQRGNVDDYVWMCFKSHTTGVIDRSRDSSKRNISHFLYS